MSMFKKASKAQSRARIALVGPTGAGKTWTAILLARLLCPPERDPKGWRVAVIDTERGSASLYAGDVAEFDVCELPGFAPQQYIEAISAAGDDGYDVAVIDSLSHAWAGKDGVLEIVDNAAARTRGNKFAAWREGTPQQNALVDAILQAPMHVIATMRAKTEYVLEEGDNGKKVPRKIGMAPIQRDQIEFEFSLCADLDTDHKILVSKSRCPALDRAVLAPPGNTEKLAAAIRLWLSDGVSRVKALTDAYEQATDSKALLAARGEVKKAWKGLTAEERKTVEAAAVAATQRITAAKPPPGAPADHGDEEMPEDLFGGAAQ